MLDMHGWDLPKTLRMIRDSNCSVVEWLSSPIVYRSDPAFVADALALLKRYGSQKALGHHLMNKAKRHLREHLPADRSHIALKKYFFVIQPLLSIMWMREHSPERQQEKEGELDRTAPSSVLLLPPLQLQSLLDASQQLPAHVKGCISQLIDAKKKGDLSNGTHILDLDQWIDVSLQDIDAWLKTMLPNRNSPMAVFNSLFAKYAIPFRNSTDETDVPQ
jgi:predicted nucleotidyltransferase